MFYKAGVWGNPVSPSAHPVGGCGRARPARREPGKPGFPSSHPVSGSGRREPGKPGSPIFSPAGRVWASAAPAADAGGPPASPLRGQTARAPRSKVNTRGEDRPRGRFREGEAPDRRAGSVAPCLRLNDRMCAVAGRREAAPPRWRRGRCRWGGGPLIAGLTRGSAPRAVVRPPPSLPPLGGGARRIAPGRTAPQRILMGIIMCRYPSCPTGLNTPGLCGDWVSIASCAVFTTPSRSLR